MSTVIKSLDIIPLIVYYEMIIQVKLWDKTPLTVEEQFIYELITEFRSLINGVNIPDNDGNIQREFILSNYMKYYDKLPWEPQSIIPLENGKAIIQYTIGDCNVSMD